MNTNKYDVAAYIWPAYTGQEERTHIFWPEKNGEWQTVRKAASKISGDNWPRKPLWGYVDEADPYVMEMEIEAAANHGVNVFIYDWYWYDRRPFLEQCLNNGYLNARNNDMVKFYLMWANHDATSAWDTRTSDENTCIWEGKVDAMEFIRLSDRLIEKYFKLDNYYKIDGKPVFQIYDTANFINSFGSMDMARAAMEDFRKRAVSAGLPGLYLIITMWGFDAVYNLSGVDGSDKTDVHKAVKELGFDGITHYQYVHFTDVNRGYEQLIPDVLSEWEKIDMAYDIPYFPHVSLGWDSNPRFNKFRPDIITDCTPEAIEKALKAAKEYADKHPKQMPLITVNSWNEWTETSYLQPDDLYGYGYLRSVKNVFK